MEKKSKKQNKDAGKSREKDLVKFQLDVLDMISAPIITFSTSWADAIPQQLRENIRTERMVSALKKEEMATVPEVLAYLITRSMEAPLPSEWMNIYSWCGTVYFRKYKDLELPKTMVQESLSEHETSLLNKLRAWIYTKRRDHLKNKINGSKK